ncbi:MAG: chromate transporter [Lachnospiraceae bacterium]|nr:chromate transporter [Lachnospiraceae bacterium]
MDLFHLVKLKNQTKLLLDLFLTFAKIGMFTFGGGYAMLSLIENTCIENKKWITHDEMTTVTVIAESTPGPIAINCATYVGYKKGKLLGAIAATFGMVLPSFVIIYLISKFLNQFLEITWVNNAFKGIKIAVGILIVDAAVKMLKKMKKKPMQIIMVCFATVSMLLINIFALNISSMILMLVSAVVGIVVFFINNILERKRVKK